MSRNPLRNIPSVGELLDSPPLRGLVDRISRNVVVSTVGKVLDEMRTEVQTATAEKTLPSVSDLAERIARRIVEHEAPPLREVINASGILLHPALGGAPLAEEALEEVVSVAGNYASVEIDLVSGDPSPRKTVVEDLLEELTGAEASLVVGNGAGATMLALSALAAGREVIVSRGQLVETGDGYRLPELIAASGAVLREVGTTNSTRLDDYARAIGDETALMMLIHAADFFVAGSSADVALEELTRLASRHKLPVIHDVDSAALIDLGEFGLVDEPVVGESIKSGAELAIFSGDKLLGGPQCGIIVGRRALIERIESHPMARALSVGRLTLSALAATLRLYRDKEKAIRTVPLLHLLSTSRENLKNRAERLAPQMAATAAISEAEAVAGTAHLGGGPVPTRELPSWCVALKPATMSVDRLARALRIAAPSVIGAAQQDSLLLDLRGVLPRQDLQLVAVVESLESEVDR